MGFLVSGYTVDTYRSLLDRTEEMRGIPDATVHFLTAVKGERVVGFLLAYTESAIQPHDELNLHMMQELGPLLIIKQVCIHPELARQGIARRLYQTVLARSDGLPVIAAVVSKPENVPSMRLQFAMGFEPYCNFVPADGLERTVWLYRQQSPEILARQYTEAISLYRHEDLLNWGKLNNFFYITAALFTGYALLLNASVKGQLALPSRATMIGLCCLGILVTTGFTLTLFAGVHYLAARKAVVRHFEDRLVRAGGSRVVTLPVPEGHRKTLESSPTRFMLRGIPIAIGLGWTAALIAACVV